MKAIQNYTDAEITAHCNSQTKESLLKYLASHSQECSPKDKKKDLVSKAVEVARRIKSQVAAADVSAQDTGTTTMQDLINQARTQVKSKKSDKGAKGPNKRLVAYVEIIRELANHPNGIMKEDLFRLCSDGRRTPPSQSAINTFDCRLYEIGIFLEMFGLGDFSKQRSTGIVKISLSNDIKTSDIKQHFYRTNKAIFDLLDSEKRDRAGV